MPLSALRLMHTRFGHAADLELCPRDGDALFMHSQVCHERPALAAQHEAVRGHFLRVAPLAEERIVRLVEAAGDQLAQLAVELRGDVRLARVLESSCRYCGRHRRAHSALEPTFPPMPKLAQPVLRLAARR